MNEREQLVHDINRDSLIKMQASVRERLKAQEQREQGEQTMSKRNIFDKRQLQIARSALKYSPILAPVMTGMTHEDAKQVIKELAERKRR